MTNLHLMPMSSTFDDDTVIELNKIFPIEENHFVLVKPREAVAGIENCEINPEAFTPEYINAHCSEYKYVVLHSLFLSSAEILRLSDEALPKIIWCVWGHDLYTVRKKEKITFKRAIDKCIHFAKMVLRGTHIRVHRYTKKVASRVAKFHAIAIGYPYDEKMIRKKYGKEVPVKMAGYYSSTTKDNIDRLRQMHLTKTTDAVNVIIGHCGFEFIEHEKYLKRLAKYKDENIHINMILSYGASQERINILTNMAYSIFGREKCTIVTEFMPKIKYYEFLTNMDIAIFPYKHQSGVGNVVRMAYMGVKMYFNRKGVLFGGFKAGGVNAYNCRDIGKVSFKELSSKGALPEKSAPLFAGYKDDRNIESWLRLLKD